MQAFLREKTLMKKIFVVLTLGFFSATLFLIPPLGKAAGEPRDFDSNATIKGGAYTKEELMTKINNGDGVHTDLKQVMFSENRGITEVGIMSSQDGVVKKDGTVWVGGAQVASGIFSSGRSYIPGSTRDGTLWMRPPSVSFLSSQLDAFVIMNGGTFQAAIIKACGNPIKILAAPFPQVFKRVKNERVGGDFVAADTRETALSVREGDPLTFEVIVTNQGTTSATDVQITDSIPQGLSMQNPARSRDIIAPLGSIPNQDRKFILIHVIVNAGTAGQCIENIANMTASGGYSDKDSAFVCVTPAPVPQQVQNIRIIKFEDINRNGVQDVGEIVLPGFTFRLDDGITLVTDANGIVVFANVTVGDHKVEEINLPSGWVAINQNPFTVNVPSGQTVTRFFGNQKPLAPVPVPLVPAVPPAVASAVKGEVLGAQLTKGQLPQSGPAETAVAGAFGFSMLGYSGVYYLRAKKKFLMTLRKKK